MKKKFDSPEFRGPDASKDAQAGNLGYRFAQVLRYGSVAVFGLLFSTATFALLSYLFPELETKWVSWVSQLTWILLSFRLFQEIVFPSSGIQFWRRVTFFATQLTLFISLPSALMFMVECVNVSHEIAFSLAYLALSAISVLVNWGVVFGKVARQR